MGPADDDDDDDGLSDEFVVVAIRSGDRVRHLRIPREVFDELRRYVLPRTTYHGTAYHLHGTMYRLHVSLTTYHVPLTTYSLTCTCTASH